MAITTEPQRLLGKWLKDHAHSNTVHKVARVDQGEILCYCGRLIKCGEAVEPVQSVACCVDCTGKWRANQRAKRFNTIPRESIAGQAGTEYTTKKQETVQGRNKRTRNTGRR
jgi:hypothetical protein